MAVYENSRYLQTRPYRRKNYESIYIFHLWNRPYFNISEGAVYEWVEGDTLDGVSYKYYQNCNLWWAILSANPEYRTEFDIVAGDHIFIPDYEEVCRLVNVESGGV